MDSAKLRRFGVIVRKRRLALGLLQDQVHAAGGPSDKRQTGIENGLTPAPSLTTLAKVDAGLQWAPGSAAATLGGGLPTPLDRPAFSAEDVERHTKLTVALERAGVHQVTANGAQRTAGGTALSADVVDQLIEILNSLPQPDDSQ